MADHISSEAHAVQQPEQPNQPEQPLFQVVPLGRIVYTEAWALQEKLARLRGADRIPDTLLLVEHPHTYTLGSSGHTENLLLSPEEMQARGIEVHWVNRGGDVTYHGPGQLVAYPLLKLPRAGEGLHADVITYVRTLEQTIIDVLKMYGLGGWPYPGLTGVWVGEPSAPAKVAAIGVKITVRRVTMHGFALNMNTDLDYFRGIIPCGITDKAVTSMQELLGHPVDEAEVARRSAEAFGTRFGRDVVWQDNFDTNTLLALSESV